MKESRAWDEKQPCNEKLGFEHRSAEGARETTDRARFEDNASEEQGTTGRTRARTSCPVQEPRRVSLELGYSTDLFVPACRKQENHRPGLQHHQRSARLYVEYTRPRNRPRALQGGRQCRRHRSKEREECATREPERAWTFSGDRWRLQGIR